MQNMSIVLLFIIIAVIVFAVLAAVIFLIVNRKKPSAQNPKLPPIPQGEGMYTMQIGGMNCEHCRATAEAALNAIPDVQAKVDLKTNTAAIRYTGCQNLDLLDQLRHAVEEAGFTVDNIR